MLNKPYLATLLDKTGNRYTLTCVIARRVRQLVSGAQPLAESESPNLVTLACEELAAEGFEAVPGMVNPQIPLRPDIVAKKLQARAFEAERLADGAAEHMGTIQGSGTSQSELNRTQAILRLLDAEFADTPEFEYVDDSGPARRADRDSEMYDYADSDDYDDDDEDNADYLVEAGEDDEFDAEE
ncbi:MAG: DNA-directed RNA polymerase subunit omega [Clostridiaceae bacterium]|nr:DNA-directed RNA polymerase subunit omega [Clostridiaceae bacterium]